MNIWPWSEIVELRRENKVLRDSNAQFWRQLTDNNQYLDRIVQQTSVANAGLARILAKLDPIFGMTEDDPKRIADSKRLEAEIINKLTAEHVALKSRNLLP